MRNIDDKQDSISTLSAAEFNGSIMRELENAVTSSGIALDPAGGDDTNTRMLAQALTRTTQGAAIYQDSGRANAYVLTALGGYVQPTEYTHGMTITFQARHTNTRASTVNIASIGTVDLVDKAGEALAAGSIKENDYIVISYDSSDNNFRIISGQSTSGGIVGIQVFTSSGTYTPNSKMQTALVVAIGGGGGGGGAVSGKDVPLAAGGGGGGGAAIGFFSRSGEIKVTVGTGGAGGSSSGGDGGDGGLSSFGNIVSANGGNSGSGTTSNPREFSVALGGYGGAGEVGSVTFSGSNGLHGFTSHYSALGGAGGAAALGGSGGHGESRNDTGVRSLIDTSGRNYGGGGGAAAAGLVNHMLTKPGSPGAPGVVYVIEYGG